jgi:hypothetical protein
MAKSRKVAHKATAMTGMKNPTKRLTKVIRGVENAWDVGSQNISVVFPILYRKPLDINMARSFCGLARIDHFNGRLIVNVEHGGVNLPETKIVEDRTEVASGLRGRDSGKEFRLCGAGGSDRLCLGPIGNSSVGQTEGITRGGTTVAKIIRMRCVNVAHEMKRGRRAGEGRQGWVHREVVGAIRRERKVRRGTFETKTPGGCAT